MHLVDLLIIKSSGEEDVTLLYFPNLKDTQFLLMKRVICKNGPAVVLQM